MGTDYLRHNCPSPPATSHNYKGQIWKKRGAYNLLNVQDNFKVLNLYKNIDPILVHSARSCISMLIKYQENETNKKILVVPFFYD